MRRCVVGCLAVLCMAAQWAMSGELMLAGDYQPPYARMPGEEAPGFMVEAVQRILGEVGVEVNYVLEKDREKAIEKTRLGRYGALLMATPGETPDLVFPGEDMGTWRVTLFARRGGAFEYTGFDSLPGRRVVGLRGRTYGDELQAWVEDHGVLVNSLEEAVVRIFSGQAELLAEDRHVMDYYAMSQYMRGEFVPVGEVSAARLYVAFSPALPEARHYANLLAEGVRRMKADGSWATLLDRYGLSPD